ncbi:MAG: hypothetical protein AAF542_17900 [Pseudomonadota bacterium]
MTELFHKLGAYDPIDRDGSEVGVDHADVYVTVPDDRPIHVGARWGGINLAVANDFSSMPSGAELNTSAGPTSVVLTANGGSYNYRSLAVRAGHTYALGAKLVSTSGSSTVRLRGEPPAGTAVLSDVDAGSLVEAQLLFTSTADGDALIGLDNRALGPAPSLNACTVSITDLLLVDVTDWVTKVVTFSEIGRWVGYLQASYIGSDGVLQELAGPKIDANKIIVNGNDQYAKLDEPYVFVGGDVLEAYFTRDGIDPAKFLFDLEDVAGDRFWVYNNTLNYLATSSGTENVNASAANVFIKGVQNHLKVTDITPGQSFDLIGNSRNISATNIWDGSIWQVSITNGGVVKHRWKLDEETGPILYDSVGDKNGTFIGFPAPPSLLPRVADAMKGLQIHGFDWANENPASEDIDATHYFLSGDVTPSTGALRFKGINFTALSRVSGSTASSVLQKATLTSNGGHYHFLVAILAGANYTASHRPGFLFNGISSGGLQSTVEVIAGPGQVFGSGSGTVPEISGITATDITWALVKTNSPIPVEDFRTYFYLDRSTADDVVLYLSAYSVGKGHIPRIVHTSGAPAIGVRDVVTRSDAFPENNITFRFVFRPSFNHDDDKGSSSLRLVSLQGDNLTDAIEIVLAKATRHMYVYKYRTGTTPPGLTLDPGSYVRDERVEIEVRATASDFGIRANGGAWVTTESAEAKAPWTNLLKHITLGGRRDGTQGCSIIAESFSWTNSTTYKSADFRTFQVNNEAREFLVGRGH